MLESVISDRWPLSSLMRFPGLPCIEYKKSAAKPATRISGVTLHITCIDKGDPILLQAVDSGPGVQIIRSEGDPSNLCVDLRVSPVHIDKSHRFREAAGRLALIPYCKKVIVFCQLVGCDMADVFLFKNCPYGPHCIG